MKLLCELPGWSSGRSSRVARGTPLVAPHLDFLVGIHQSPCHEFVPKFCPKPCHAMPYVRFYRIVISGRAGTGTIQLGLKSRPQEGFQGILFGDLDTGTHEARINSCHTAPASFHCCIKDFHLLQFHGGCPADFFVKVRNISCSVDQCWQ